MGGPRRLACNHRRGVAREEISKMSESKGEREKEREKERERESLLLTLRHLGCGVLRRGDDSLGPESPHRRMGLWIRSSFDPKIHTTLYVCAFRIGICQHYLSRQMLE